MPTVTPSVEEPSKDGVSKPRGAMLQARRWFRDDPGGSPQPTAGLFITLEGCDGTGKSTQAALLKEWLEAECGVEVVKTFEPGDSALGKQLRQLIQHGEEMDERTEALLFAADRAHHVATVIRPALERGAVVICDRYSDSSVAYQGVGRKLVPAEVERISQWATHGLRPDVTLLFDVDPEVAAARLGAPTDRIESAGQDFQANVRAAYLELAAKEPERWELIDANGTIEEIAAKVQTLIAIKIQPKNVSRETSTPSSCAESCAQPQHGVAGSLEADRFGN